MFMTLAKIWQQIEKERTQLQARVNLFKCLMGLKNIFNKTLSEYDVVEAQAKLLSINDTGVYNNIFVFINSC